MRLRNPARLIALVSALAASLGTTAGRARADEITVFAAGAVQKAIEPLAKDFEARTGHRIVAVYDTVGALRDRALAGEAPHLIIVSAAAITALEDKGRVQSGSRHDIGRTGVGLMARMDAARLDAPPVDLSTPDHLKALLLAAKSIAHADPARGATAGTHFRKVLGDLGLLPALAERITVVPFGGTIAAQVAAGQFEIGVSQATEILPNPSVRFLGFLPDSLQLWTVYTIAGIAPTTPPAAAFRADLLGPTGQAALARIGFKP